MDLVWSPHVPGAELERSRCRAGTFQLPSRNVLFWEWNVPASDLERSISEMERSILEVERSA